MKKSDLKSFTLLETIIVMVLSTLVLMIAFLAFDVLHRQYISYQKNSSKINNFYFFYTTLDQDFDNATVTRNNNDFTLQKKHRKITYSLQENQIIRNENGNSDTLIKGIYNISLLNDTIIQNQHLETLFLFMPKDTLEYPFCYYTVKNDSVN